MTDEEQMAKLSLKHLAVWLQRFCHFLSNMLHFLILNVQGLQEYKSCTLEQTCLSPLRELPSQSFSSTSQWQAEDGKLVAKLSVYVCVCRENMAMSYW